MTEEEEYQEILNEMKSCDDCIKMKMQGSIPAICQYHLDKQIQRDK